LKEKPSVVTLIRTVHHLIIAERLCEWYSSSQWPDLANGPDLVLKGVC